MGKPTISMAIFNSYLYVYQRVNSQNLFAPSSTCHRSSRLRRVQASLEGACGILGLAAPRHASCGVQDRLCDSVGYLGISPTHVIEFQ